MKAQKILTFVLSYLLFTTSFLPPAFAQARADLGKDNAKNSQTGFGDVANAVMGGLDFAGNFFKQMNQQKMQTMMMLNAFKGTDVKTQFVPAKYFPHCAITPAQMDYPKEACQKISNPTELTMAEQLSSSGYMRVNLLDQMTSRAQNGAQPVGLMCLEDGLKKQMLAVDDKLNSLESMTSEIKKMNEDAKRLNELALESMKALTDRLTGTKNSSNAQTEDISLPILKDSNCNNVLSKASFNGGLRGAYQSMTAPDNSGKSLSRNAEIILKDRNKIEEQIMTQIQRARDSLKKNGAIEGATLLTQSNELTRGGYSDFPVLKESIIRKVGEVQRAYERIKGKLESEFPGYKMPPLDRNFTKNMDRFSQNSASYFKKKMIDDCVTMKDKTGLGLSRDQILSSLKQRSTGNSGNTTKSYQARLSAILNSDAFIQDKLQAIGQLDKEFGKGNITITLNSNGSQRTLSPYDMFQEMVGRCESRFVEDKTYTKEDKEGSASQSEIVKEAQAYVEEIRNLDKNLADNFVSEAREELISCAGKPKAQLGSCDNESLNMGSKNFCLDSASSCAGQVKSCEALVQNQVKITENQLKQAAISYNVAQENIRLKQEASLNNLKARVFSDAEFFKNYFPDSAWAMPEDLFISKSSLAQGGPLGIDPSVQLISGGNQDFLNELPLKLAKLKTVLSEQKEKIKASVTEYISKQEEAMNANKNRWDQVAQRCSSVAKNYRDQTNKASAEAMAKYSEGQQKASEFCSRFSDLAQSSPGVGCSGSNSPEKLYTEMMKVSSQLDPSVGHNIRDYQELCYELQGEATSKSTSKKKSKDDDDEDEEAKETGKVAKVVEMCEEGSWSNVKGTIVDLMLKSAPSSIASKKGEIADSLRDGKEITLSEDIQNSSWGRSMVALSKAFERAKVEDQIKFPEITCAEEKKACLAKKKAIESLKAKYKDDNQDYCKYLQISIKLKAIESIEDDKFTLNKASKKEAELTKSLDGYNDVANINRIISGTLGKTKTIELKKKWSEIGERWGASCKAGAGGTYQNRMLGEFQQKINQMPGVQPNVGVPGMIQGI